MITIIPLCVLLSYVITILVKERATHNLIKIAAIVSISMIGWFGFQFMFGIEEGNFYTCALLVFSSFLILRSGGHSSSCTYNVVFSILVVGMVIIGVQNPHSCLLIELLLLMLFFLAESNLKFLRKSYEDSANEYQNKILNQQVEEVQNIYLTMRGWRHDYHNHLQTLKAHLKMGNIGLAKEYLYHLEEDLDQVNTLLESGNVRLDAILNSKLSLAVSQEIDVDYKASVPEQLTVADLDLCVIIGNLIDNAVESCEKIKDGRKFIRLYIGVLRNQLYITITNSTSEVIRKIDEEYITTKRGNHRHGLKRIQNTVEKYDGYMNRKNEPGVFVTEIMLPL